LEKVLAISSRWLFLSCFAARRSFLPPPDLF